MSTTEISAIDSKNIELIVPIQKIILEYFKTNNNSQIDETSLNDVKMFKGVEFDAFKCSECYKF